MSKESKNKPVRMTLAQFYQHINDQARATRNRTRALPRRILRDGERGTSGRLSERLNARRDVGNTKRGQRHYNDSSLTAARVVGSKSSTKDLVFNDKTFPLLNNTEAPDVQTYGAWAHGIQSIIDAKDLPDPCIVAEQERCSARTKLERNRFNRGRYYNDYDSEYTQSECESDYEDGQQPHNQFAHVVVVNVPEFSEDDENWDEL